MSATALKILSDTGDGFVVGGFAAVFGGRDITNERFTKQTDFWLDHLSAPPILYQHGADPVLKRTVVGRVTSHSVEDAGLWVTAQLEASKAYLSSIRKLIEKGVLGFSIGTAGHLMERAKTSPDGVTEITRFPMVELSLTPTPAEPRTIGVRELKSLAASDPALRSIAQEAESLAGGTNVKDLPDAAFAFVESGGVLDDDGLTTPRKNRRLPHHDDGGEVDPDLLAASVAEAKATDDQAGLAHLLRHAKALADGTHDDAHTSEWAEGAAASKALVLSERLRQWSEQVATEQASMRQIGMDTKSGSRIRPELRVTGDEINTELHRVLDWAQTVDRGVDGRARVDRLKQELALMDLEV